MGGDVPLCKYVDASRMSSPSKKSPEQLMHVCLMDKFNKQIKTKGKAKQRGR